MANEADQADDYLRIQQLRTDSLISDIRAKVSSMPAGVFGECDYCGEERTRLVNGVCAACRDRYRLP
jgi:RNA polymerase-binding transcription factor DksA